MATAGTSERSRTRIILGSGIVACIVFVCVLDRQAQTKPGPVILSSSLLPLSLSPPLFPARTSSLVLLNSNKAIDKGSIVGVYGVTVDADSDCQHVLPCPAPKPKPIVSAPVHYHKEINVIGFGNDAKDKGGVGDLAVSRKELDSRIKFLRHTMDSLRDQLQFVKQQRGDQGHDGSPGVPGPPGRNGKNGAPGRNGNNGAEGKRGKSGKEGPPGPPGDDGKDGYVAGGGWTMQLFESGLSFGGVPDWTTLSYLGGANVPAVSFPSWKEFHSVIKAVPKENFAWRFYGKVWVEEGDEYKFCTVSDDRSRLFLEGHLILDNKDVSKRQCVSAELEPGIHALVVDGYNNGGPGGVSLTYSGKDTKGEQKPVPSVDARAAPPPLPSRFTLRTYASTELKLTKVPLPSEGELLGEALVPLVDFDGVGAFKDAIPSTPDSNFFYQFFGKLAVNVGGGYRLCVRSSDGSRLDVDEHTLVDNDGLHEARKRCTTASLAPGIHDLLVEGFLSVGSVDIEATYSGPDTYFLPQPLHSVDPSAPAPPRPSEWLLEVYRPVYKAKNLKQIPDFPSAFTADLYHKSRLHPVGEALVPVLDFHGEGPEHGYQRYVARTPQSDFAFIAYGAVEVASPGVYTFCTKSKDGYILQCIAAGNRYPVYASSMEVDGLKLVDNDGVHDMRQKCGTQVLASGLHLVKVKGFHGGGRVSFEAIYKGPDTGGDYVLIPSVQASTF